MRANRARRHGRVVRPGAGAVVMQSAPHHAHLDGLPVMPVCAVPVLLPVAVALARHHHNVASARPADGHADGCRGKRDAQACRWLGSHLKTAVNAGTTAHTRRQAGRQAHYVCARLCAHPPWKRSSMTYTPTALWYCSWYLVYQGGTRWGSWQGGGGRAGGSVGWAAQAVGGIAR